MSCKDEIYRIKIILTEKIFLEGSDSFLELECHIQSSGQVVANQQVEIADLQSLCRMLSRVRILYNNNYEICAIINMEKLFLLRYFYQRI